MGRPALHSDDSILDAAREVVLERGARATTLNAIASAGGAPKGSIYHRYASQEDLLAAMWIRAVSGSQAAFIEALEDPDPLEAAVGAALSLPKFAAGNPADARLLVSLRREDLFETVGSPELRRQLKALNRPLEVALAELARRLFGKATRDRVEQVVFSVVDLPIGASRRHLAAGSPLPDTLPDQLEAAVRAALIHARGDSNVRKR